MIPETEYGADVTLTVLLPEEKAEAYLAHILDMTAGTVEGIATGSGSRTCLGGPPEGPAAPIKNFLKNFDFLEGKWGAASYKIKCTELYDLTCTPAGWDRRDHDAERAD